MANDQSRDGDRKNDRKDDQPGARKRRWEKPRIETGQLFEANSLACSKNGPQVEECLQGGEPKS